MSAVIGVDPGSAKAGYALVGRGGDVLRAGIESLEQLPARLAQLLAESEAEAIALGRGTNARCVLPMLTPLGLPVHLVDERETTRLARRLYFEEHPPTGWRRLIPVGLQLPMRPIDDYAAILIARRFLARGVESGPPS
ncbi:MAG: pre-16S rRNA-processing nuclease YqgF [Candidatus Eremiobacteraeota bacterium]|nr:pre-16S rRNA-processing nuclease YqgF [Candidatus Eremiobacteraeota bacterium]